MHLLLTPLAVATILSAADATAPSPGGRNAMDTRPSWSMRQGLPLLLKIGLELSHRP